MATARIKDVARHAGVSVATVTRVVNNSGYVSDEKRRLVERAVRELRYIPNRMASALKNNSTRILGIVTPTSSINAVFVSINAAIGRAAAEADYHTLTMSSNLDPRQEGHLIRELIAHMAEGIIFTSAATSKPEVLQQALDKDIPVIMIERPLDLPGIDKVLIDDWEGSTLAARHLLERGHTRIGFIGLPPETHAVEAGRFGGLEKTLAGADAPLAPQRVAFAPDYGFAQGYAGMAQLLDAPPAQWPTACLLGSDILLCGALQCLYERKLRVPEDMSLLGYDNTLSASCAPPVTTIAFPYDEIGKTVMTLFTERRQGGRKTSKTVTLAPVLLDRGSVRSLG